MQKSIDIHLPQCEAKFKKENKTFGIKRKLPKRPQELDNILTMETISNEILEQYNNIAMQVYNDSSLSRCPNCKRTFNLESLQVHLRSCNKKNGTNADPYDSNK